MFMLMTSGKPLFYYEKTEGLPTLFFYRDIVVGYGDIGIAG